MARKETGNLKRVATFKTSEVRPGLCRLLTAGASLGAEQGLWGVRPSVAAAPGLKSTDSVVGTLSCPCSTRESSRPGIKPVSLALAGDF